MAKAYYIYLNCAYNSQRIQEMDADHAPIRTAEHRDELLGLPALLASLELKIQEVGSSVGNTALGHAQNGSSGSDSHSLPTQPT